MNQSLYIVWTENNSIGYPIVDEQHRGIISVINTLYYFHQNGKGSEIIKPTMTMLEQYVDYHFRTEEALLKEKNYPDLDQHIALHKELNRKTIKLTDQLRKDENVDDILKFLKEWWLGHINKEDKKYMPYLNI